MYKGELFLKILFYSVLSFVSSYNNPYVPKGVVHKRDVHNFFVYYY